MKGAIETMQLLVLSLIVILIAVAISSYFVPEAKGLYAAGKAAQVLPGSPGQVSSPNNPPGQSGTPVQASSHIYTALGNADPFRPSEIACLISNSIYNDYMKNGPTGSRGSNCFIVEDGKYHYCLVDSKTFQLQAGGNDEIAWRNDLIAQNCSLCSNKTPSESGVETVVPMLDEVCINYDLNRTTDDGWNFCKGSIYSIGGAFSNCDCGVHDSWAAQDHGNSQVPNWNSKCDGYWNKGGLFGYGQGWVKCNDGKFCDNQQNSASYADNMILWHADKAENGEDNYLVSDHEKEIYDNRGEFDENSLDLTSNYTYGIVWIPERKQYYLYFEKIPMQKKETDFSFLIDNIARINYQTPYLSGIRINPLGFTMPETRRIMDRVVNLSSSYLSSSSSIKTVGDLMTAVRDALNTIQGQTSSGSLTPWMLSATEGCNKGIYFANDFNCIYEKGCDGINCISQSNTLSTLGTSWVDSLGTGIDGPMISAVSYGWTFSIDNKITNDDNGKLLPDTNYRVVVDYWIHPDLLSDDLYSASAVDKSINIYKMTS